MSPKDTRKKNLGRGLDALLGGDTKKPSSGEGPAGSASKDPAALPIEHIRPGKYQPRRAFDDDEMKSLVASVRTNGILQPILVRPLTNRNDSFEIVAGERRWRAAQEAQLHEIPVIIRDMSDVEALEIALVENLQRQDLTPLEEAEGYQRLITEFRHTQDALAQSLGKSRSHVANMIRLLGLPQSVKKMLSRGDLSAGHARAILNAERPAEMAEQVSKRGLNVRQTEALVQAERIGPGTKKAARRPRAVAGKNPDTVSLERRLSESLGFNVTINEHGDGGEVVVRYASLEQLDDIIERLQS